MDRTQDTGTEPRTLPAEVSLLPLPDHVLLPGVSTPYRIFEPRYLAMLDDVLARPEGERFLAIARLAPGWQADYHGSPAFHPVATVGRVTSAEPLANGHRLILVEGLARGRLLERPAQGPWRVARVEPVPDLPMTSAQRARLLSLLESTRQAVFTLSRLLGESAADLAEAAGEAIEPSLLLDRLAACAMDRPDERQAVLGEPSLPARAEKVLDALSRLVVLASRHVGPGVEA